MNIRNLFIGAAIAAATASVANAGTIVLTFDQLNGSVNESPLNYYDGGYGSDGTGPGPNYGITFTSNTITGCTQPAACADTNSAGNPSSPNVIFFLTGSAATMNVASGFTTGFSFYYSSINETASINVWSGQNDTGTLLTTLTLPQTSDDGASNCYSEPFCPYVPIGVTFAGTAESVDFGGTENQVGFDNITLGSSTAGGVPEPATWAMMLVGFVGMGAAMRSRRKAMVAA